MVCHCLQLSWQSAIDYSCCDTKILKTSPNVIFMEKHLPKKCVNKNGNNLRQKPVLIKLIINEEFAMDKEITPDKIFPKKENFGKKTNAHFPINEI